jgi:hypothetical protein
MRDQKRKSNVKRGFEDAKQGGMTNLLLISGSLPRWNVDSCPHRRE